MNKTTYLLLRLTIGTSMLGHGLIRFTKLRAFSSGMVKHFEKSPLPAALVTPFSYALPFAEFIVGLLVIVGLFSRQAFIAGMLVMIVLVFGSSMIEDWNSIPSQLIHAAFFAVLLQFAGSNTKALDGLLKK